MKSLPITTLALTVALVGLAAPPSLAVDEGPAATRFFISAGGYLSDFDTRVAIGSGNILGTLFAAESLLGLDDSVDLFRLDGFYRITERQKIGFGYFDVHRTGLSAIDESIEFEEVLFEIGALVESEFDTTWFRVDWRFAAIQSKRGDAGFVVGLSTYDFDISLAGIALVSDGTGQEIHTAVREETQVLAPVPTLGIFLNFQALRWLQLKAQLDYLDLDVGEFDGKVADTSLTLEFILSRHFGLGLGLNSTEISIRKTGDSPYFVDYEQSGVVMYLSYRY